MTKNTDNNSRIESGNGRRRVLHVELDGVTLVTGSGNVDGLSAHYQALLAKAAGRGFVSVRIRSRWARVIEGALKRGFRRVTLTNKKEGEIEFQGYYGPHKMVRQFNRNPDGTLPDNGILDEIMITADRMDQRRPGGRCKTRSAWKQPRERLHPIYVTHGNESAKLEELIAAMPPEGGMAAYLAGMSANDNFKEQGCGAPRIDAVDEEYDKPMLKGHHTSVASGSEWTVDVGASASPAE